TSRVRGTSAPSPQRYEALPSLARFLSASALIATGSRRVDLMLNVCESEVPASLKAHAAPTLRPSWGVSSAASLVSTLKRRPDPARVSSLARSRRRLGLKLRSCGPPNAAPAPTLNVMVVRSVPFAGTSRRVDCADARQSTDEKPSNGSR